MKLYKDEIFNFFELFNEDNGTLIRTNILDENGNETKIIPFKRSFPELIDIGIMGHCHNNETCKSFGVDCYQGNMNEKDMDLSDYKSIIDQCVGKTFQVALGGKGDPNKHLFFEDILKYTVSKGICVNMTTSGLLINEKEIDLICKYCSAVAVSFYSTIDYQTFEESNDSTIKLLNCLSNRIKTNVHYVVSNDTIDNLIFRLENDLFPKGINGLILLLYKKVGYGTENKLLTEKEKLLKLFSIISNKEFPYKIGFDSCFSPLVLKNMSDKIAPGSIEICEAARFSCYIDNELNVFPCSFVKNKEYSLNLKNYTLNEIWFSNNFQKYINQKSMCEKCKNKCDGGCKNNLNQFSCISI